MFTCPICKMEDLPKECMVVDKDGSRCVCCDFEDFLGSDEEPAKANEIVARMVQDVVNAGRTIN